MHELSVVEGIREIALRHTRSVGAWRIVPVRVVIADTSSHLEDALAGEECFADSIEVEIYGG